MIYLILLSLFIPKSILYTHTEETKLTQDRIKDCNEGFDERYFNDANLKNDTMIGIDQIADNMLKLEKLRILQNKNISMHLREIIAKGILGIDPPDQDDYLFNVMRGGLMDSW